MQITDKVFVVTGGGNGIGREVVLALLARGVIVAAVDLSREGLDETTELATTASRTGSAPTSSTSPTGPPSRRSPTRCARRTVASTGWSTWPASSSRS